MRCCEDDPRADDSPAADDPEVSLVEKGWVSGLAKDNLPRPGPGTGLLAIHDPDATWNIVNLGQSKMLVTTFSKIT